MTIDEAKKLLPPELKYPLPDGTIDNLMEIQKLALGMSDPEDTGMHYAMMAALIELKELKQIRGFSEFLIDKCAKLEEENAKLSQNA